jgi:DNA topoisomerase-1
MPEVAGRFVPKDPAFEALHPRDRSGRDRGEFIDVPGIMAALGAVFDEGSGGWVVPNDRASELQQHAAEWGFRVVTVPDGMRPATPDDMAARWGRKQKIPPGWTDVMVAVDPGAPVQVKGRDAQGRPQTIRSLNATQAASAKKFARIKLLSERLPAVDARLKEDALGDDTAAAMMLVRKMGLRPGSTKDTKARAQAYGASTLRRRHVQVTGDTVRLRFVGKEGVELDLTHTDPDLARVLRKRLAGRTGDEPIFPDTNANLMNRWVKDVAGDSFTVKDFRTHLGTGLAKKLVDEAPPPMTAKDHRALELRVGSQVSAVLGNTRKQALESYIDPAVFGEPPGTPSTGPEPPGSHGRAGLKAAFEAGFDEGDELTGGAMNLSIRRVTLSDGSQAILKQPATAGEHRREIVSSMVGNALGFQLYTEDVGDGRFVSSFVEGRPGAAHIDGELLQIRGIDDDALAAHQGRYVQLLDEAARRPGGREIGVMDWLIRNRDRHDGNWLVTSDGGVAPIDHGLTVFDPEGADRDIPLSPFAHRWLGIDQKPTPRPARGVPSNEVAARTKTPRVRLEPRVSKAYVDGVRKRLERGRAEYSDKEWAGIMARLDLLYAAAPDTIDGEAPLPEVA